MIKKPTKKSRHLFNVNLINLSGKLTEKNTTDIIDQLIEMNADKKFDRIILAINSGGGSVYQAFAIYDMIKALKKPVDTVLVGMAHSAAVIILQAGRQRYTLPNGDIFIHEVGTDFKDRLTAENLECEYRNLRIVQDRMLKILSQRTGINSEELLSDCKVSMTFEAEKAVEYGFVDKVIDSIDDMLEYYYAAY